MSGLLRVFRRATTAAYATYPHAVAHAREHCRKAQEFSHCDSARIVHVKDGEEQSRVLGGRVGAQAQQQAAEESFVHLCSAVSLHWQREERR